MAHFAQRTDLATHVPLIGPSLLACDFGHLAQEIHRLEEAGAKILHLDVMDGHFVPNLSFGIPLVEAIRRETKLLLDVHLMISNPESYIKTFREAGADLLTIHIEVHPDPSELLHRIHELGAMAGISLNPPTHVSAIEPYLSLCDLVLVMSVMPGFGGQTFDVAALDKLRQLRLLAPTPQELLLSIDGGVNVDTIGDCAKAGADLFVVGTGLFAHDNYAQQIESLCHLVKLS